MEFLNWYESGRWGSCLAQGCTNRTQMAFYPDDYPQVHLCSFQCLGDEHQRDLVLAPIGAATQELDASVEKLCSQAPVRAWDVLSGLPPSPNLRGGPEENLKCAVP